MKTAVIFAVVLLVAVVTSDFVTYSSSGLYRKVKSVCCNSGKKRSEAVQFLPGQRKKRALNEECCNEGCSSEEVTEMKLLMEECTNEGCSNEEISEHC